MVICINLRALRNPNNRVDIRMTFTGVDPEIPTSRRYRRIDENGNTAIIFNFKNASNRRIANSRVRTNGVEIPLTASLTLEPEIERIRVFYWNDRGYLTKSVVECFRQKFREIGLDENEPTGDYLSDCFGNKDPRQAGNGGVIGISPTP